MRPLGLLLLATTVLTGCDSYTTVGGTIVDGDGTPIHGATIGLWREGDEVGTVTSDDEGAFFVGGTHKPTREGLCLLTQKEGFADDNRELMPNKKDDGLRIVMEHQAFIID